MCVSFPGSKIQPRHGEKRVFSSPIFDKGLESNILTFTAHQQQQKIQPKSGQKDLNRNFPNLPYSHVNSWSCAFNDSLIIISPRN